MKCPSCAAEMADDALKCDACGAAVSRAEAVRGADPDAELFCVGKVATAEEYSVIASLLEAEGIPVALMNEVGPAMNGLANGPFSWDATVGDVRVMVPKEQAQAAMDLLATQVPASATDEASESPAG